MCIDYTNLNKSIPKQLFPFSWIYQVVDTVAGHVLLCLLHAYIRCHQIPMAPEDMEKTVFVTEYGIF